MTSTVTLGKDVHSDKAWFSRKVREVVRGRGQWYRLPSIYISAVPPTSRAALGRILNLLHLSSISISLVGLW